MRFTRYHFTEDERETLRIKMLEEGFHLLKQGGIKAVNIDIITKNTYVSKGSFYNLFPDKFEFLYQIMIEKRKQVKNKLEEYLGADGKLSFEGLYGYLLWLCKENPNLMAYLNEKDVNRLVRAWPDDYLENQGNDEKTAQWIISKLRSPKENADWQMFCNYLKLGAMAIQRSDYLIAAARDRTLERLMKEACLMIAIE